ncbi:glycosyltransferase family 2 protein [Pleionea sediminis]|uniref:glycosyltransferase family 2 protein n=1 Tax=Pleionea sediminis TaxID=2569479 RepID=UPI001184A567|nr:glycosyltransferase family 2 protein [Pleionea sediminis]
MQQTKVYPQRWYDGFLGYFFRLAASGMLPASWFRDPIPKVENRKKLDGPLNLEIVSHCWQYSNMLAYQLSSFVNHPPKTTRVTVTVFYSEADKDTAELLQFFSQHRISNVNWNWQPLPKEQLFRRGIGRNWASRSTEADWVWYTDCDIIFHEGCLDTLCEQLQGRTDTLLFPRQERTTPMLAASDPMLQAGRKPQLVDIESDQFSLHSRDRAKGAFQIVHGDVARAIGYCEGLSLYQTPADHWCKCYEDRAFRWLVGTQGTPIEVPGVYQIRHIHKGRYKKDSFWSRVRSKIRRMQE